MNEGDYTQYLHSISEPSYEKKIWNCDSSKLTVLLIEGRDLPILKYNLWNLAHIYGGTDAKLHIICSNDNVDSFNKYLDEWKNVSVTVTDNLKDWNSYNDFLCSTSFYDLFDTEFLLVCQWDVFLFKQIDNIYFNYDYVGAPWMHTYFYRNGVGMMMRCGKNCGCDLCKNNPMREMPMPLKNDIIFKVGNGGFSLRRINKLKEFIKIHEKNRQKGSAEDVFFSISNLNKPVPELAYNFSIEHNICDYSLPKNPIGCHQIWKGGFDKKYIENLVNIFKCNYIKNKD